MGARNNTMWHISGMTKGEEDGGELVTVVTTTLGAQEYSQT